MNRKNNMSQTNNSTNPRRNTNNTSQQLEPLMDVFKTAMGSGFYGSVEVKLENGRITIIKKTESIKLS